MNIYNFPSLNLPATNLIINKKGEDFTVFDVVRKNHVLLTPEEWVRQHFIHFLIHSLGYPISHMAVEKSIMLGNRIKRTDILVFDSNQLPFLVVECKAAQVPINTKALHQVARYNIYHNCPYLVLTNGITSHVFTSKNEMFQKLAAMPNYI